MNLFEEIERVSGENLTSAVLRNLLFRSSEAKAALLKTMSKKSPNGPIEFRSHFSCYLEQYSKTDDENAGRIDIVIETDDAIIGIENKLNHSISFDQPEKYFSWIEKKAEELSILRGNTFRTIFFLLVPEYQREKAEEVAGRYECTSVITWQDVLNDMESSNITDPVTTAYCSTLKEYILKKVSFFHNFEETVHYLRGNFPSRGSLVQNEMIYKLWSVFPKPSRTIGRADNWVGYYFGTTIKPYKHNAWYGFVPSSRLSYSSGGKAELIIQTTFDVDFDITCFEKTDFREKFGFGEEQRLWVVQFDETWNNSGIWSEKLSPLSNAVEKLEKLLIPIGS